MHDPYDGIAPPPDPEDYDPLDGMAPPPGAEYDTVAEQRTAATEAAAGGAAETVPGYASTLTAAIAMTACCNPVCGVIAIVFAVNMSIVSDEALRHRLRRNAWNTMGIGVLTGFLLIAIAVGIASAPGTPLR
ncbi:hypothetical protein [Nocardiopsis potens]|uniref:hypothetical protein n=1 Tax=Nocardiopsis potens TaxID=1246458 RepID=UPI00034A6727|nr:hypothetical protein [Nocardiopsis potens]